MKVNKNSQKMRQTNQARKKVNNKHESKIRSSNNWDPAPGNPGQFKMKFHHVSCRIFLGLFFLLQLSEAGEKGQEKFALFMQKNVERLIEKILSQVQEYYHEIKSNAKCIPEDVPDSIMMTLKKSIDCVSENEKNFIAGKIRRKVHMKNFLNCFAEAKREINETIKAIDPEEDYCPENVTEKTYQINVTTTFIKTFQISISNGLEVTHKEIDFSKDNCDDKGSEQNENAEDENTTIDINATDSDDEDSSKHHQNHDVTTVVGPTQTDMDGFTYLKTDDSFEEDNYSLTTKHQNGDTFDVINDVSQDDNDGSIEVHSTINSHSPFIHSNKPFNPTDDRSTQGIDDFTEIYNQNSNNADLYSEPDVIYGSDYGIGLESKELEKYEHQKNKSENDSLEEYSIEYDNPEEYEENISNNDNNVQEDRPKERNNNEESISPDQDQKDANNEGVLSNAGRKSLASDIYTQLKKLREEDDYYDMKNSGKLAFKSDNEDFDEEEDENKKKRRTKNHPKALKKSVDDRKF